MADSKGDIEFTQSDIESVNNVIGMLEVFNELMNVLNLPKTQKMREIENEIYELNYENSTIHKKIGESKTCAIFDNALMSIGSSDGLLNKLHPNIVRCRKEYVFECGRADRVLFHEDGTITIVEIKPRGSRASQVQGLGQALMYAVAMREIANSNDVQVALFVSGEHDEWIHETCKSVNAIYINVPKDLEKIIDETSKHANAILNKVKLV